MNEKEKSILMRGAGLPCTIEYLSCDMVRRDEGWKVWGRIQTAQDARVFVAHASNANHYRIIA